MTEEFLANKGEHLRWQVVTIVHERGVALLPEIEQRLDELDDLIRQAKTRETRLELQAQQANLLDLRGEKRAETPVVTYRQASTDRTFAEDWSAAEDVQHRRAILDDALASITVHRGSIGRRSREQLLARLAFGWKDAERIGPVPVPDETWMARS